MDKDIFKGLVFVSFLALLLLSLVAPIDNYQYAFLLQKGIFEKDMLYKILGETKKLLSDYADLRGDEYFHGGIVATGENKCEEMTRIVADHKEGRHEDPHYHEPPHKDDKETSDISRLNILFRLGEIIHITEHIHLHGEDEKEVLPWFYYAVRLNPENIDAYVIGGYWIGQRLHRTDEAIKFLEEGLSHNPDSWQIYTLLGETYFINNKDYKHALANFQKSYDLLTDENSDKYNKREVYTFIASSYERLGKTDKAIEFYRKTLNLFPQDKSLQKKVNSLLSKIQ